MNHKKTIQELKAYTKIAAYDLMPEDFVAALEGESDRGAIILAATMIDDRLKIALQKRMPNINSVEADRIFGIDGIAGSFANRLKLAQALDIIDRPTRQFIELIRAMRNACAHSRQVLTFSTPVIRNAFVGMMQPENANDVTKWPDHQARDIFCLVCGGICDQMSGNANVPEVSSLETMIKYVRSRVRPPPSQDTQLTILG